ncbi:MAG: arginine--tRNA ligase, partial [Alphaproteobacteria bacterium]|nr:arginine--tRNA ligase [Alphaproteobacteria bacterium]
MTSGHKTPTIAVYNPNIHCRPVMTNPSAAQLPASNPIITKSPDAKANGTDNLFAQMHHQVIALLQKLQAGGQLPADLRFDGINCEPPREAAHGEVATNAAMVLAKPLGKAPRAVADLLLPALQQLPGVAAVEVAGPGFINFRFHPDFWHGQLNKILQAGDRYGYAPPAGQPGQEKDGQEKDGQGENINLEFVSVNPTGPMHVGHLRGAIFGDVLANLLIAAGNKVCREYYVNDAGNQVMVLARSAFLRYREALGQDIGNIPEGLYPGDYLKPVGQALAQRYGQELLTMPEDQMLAIVRPFAVAQMLALIKTDLASLGVVHDVFTSEAGLYEKGGIEKPYQVLEQADLIYRGTLPPPKSKKVSPDWVPGELVLMRSTRFGDVQDRPLQRSNGEWTYIAGDLPNTWQKIERGFDTLIVPLGVDHAGYVARFEAAAAALSNGTVRLEAPLTALVKFLEHGQLKKMSKRGGTFITVAEVIEEVGRDSLRFMMLWRKHNMPMDFDLAAVCEQSR